MNLNHDITNKQLVEYQQLVVLNIQSWLSDQIQRNKRMISFWSWGAGHVAWHVTKFPLGHKMFHETIIEFKNKFGSHLLDGLYNSKIVFKDPGKISDPRATNFAVRLVPLLYEWINWSLSNYKLFFEVSSDHLSEVVFSCPSLLYSVILKNYQKTR